MFNRPVCKFCNDRGCIACEGERAKRADEAIKPIFTADLNDPDDMELLKRVFHRDVIEERIEQSGGDMNLFALRTNQEAAIASVLQILRRERKAERTAVEDGQL